MRYKKTILSLVTSTLLFTGCGTEVETTVDAQSYTIDGDVKGCVVDQDDKGIENLNVRLGNVTTTTDVEGCYSLNITIESMITNSKETIIYNEQSVHIESDKYLPIIQKFTPTANVIAGVIYEFEEYQLERDIQNPEVIAMSNIEYSGNMLSSDIDGYKKPFEIELSEYVELDDNINRDTIISLQDTSKKDIVSDVTVEVKFDIETKKLSIKTSKAIASGYYVTIQIPVESIKDINGNPINTGESTSIIEQVGDSLTDYLTFHVRTYMEKASTAKAISGLVQMNEGSYMQEDEKYSEILTELAKNNNAFKNVLQYEEEDYNKYHISNFNSGGNTTNTRMQLLANELIDNQYQTSVDSSVVRIQFTPSNADYYIIKAYEGKEGTDTNLNSIKISSVDGDLNPSEYGNNLKVFPHEDSTQPLELTLSGLNPDKENTIIVVPYSSSGVAGTATLLNVKDNVAPTTSLQYSYNSLQDESSSEYSRSGGVYISRLYGGSGELSNPEEKKSPIETGYTVGTPYLEMTNDLLRDQNKTATSTTINLENIYRKSNYEAFMFRNLQRSIGIGFTEKININGTATLTTSSGRTVSNLITKTVNTVDNESVLSSNYMEEDIAIITVSDIFTLVNEHNGSVIDLTSITKDLTGNSASNAKVILIDKVSPFIVSADINTSDEAKSKIVFSEAMKSGSISIRNDYCEINDGNITGKTISLEGCSLNDYNGTLEIDFSGMPDLNGNKNFNYVFETKVVK